MEDNVFCATGKRKSAIARVRMKPGEGKFEVNRRALDEYFANDVAKMVIKQPIELTETTGKYLSLIHI